MIEVKSYERDFCNMRIKMLIATSDIEYTKLISDNISEHHPETIDVSDCCTLEGLQEAVSKRKFDVALMDSKLIKSIDTSLIKLPLVLWSENDAADIPTDFGKIKKYQRISSIVALILERYAKVSGKKHGLDVKVANITAVWSPAGGVGKTTVALACAAAHTLDDKDVFYLNLEDFSSVPGYFTETGKSISTAFEMLENPDGDLKMLIRGISGCEKGITYLCSPDNFDDMHILTPENIGDLVNSCAELTDELVIDLSCAYDARSKKAFELADRVLIVTEPGISAETKFKQFASQNNVLDHIKEKVTLVANKGAKLKTHDESVISLPFINSESTPGIYRALAENSFKS